MSKSHSFYTENSETLLFIPEVEYNEIKAKCNKNKSKSCFNKNINHGNGLLKAKYYMDDEGAIWLKNVVDNNFIEIGYDTPDDIHANAEAEDSWKELLEFCINNFRDTENNSISDFRKMKWITFCEKNKGADILTEALTEYNKRKRIEELKEDIKRLKESVFLKQLEKKLEKEEEEEEDVLVHCSNKDPIKHNVKELRQYANKIKEEEEEVEKEEEEEEEYEYTGYGIQKVYKVVINVAGGGLMNGNAYANIEGEWETEEEYETGEEGEIYYCEYGSNPSRRCVGTRIIWGEDDKFNVE